MLRIHSGLHPGQRMAFRFALTGFHPLLGFTRTLGRLTLLLCLLALAGCSGTMLLNALTPGFGYTRQAGIVFDENTGLRLDVYAPSGARNAPVAVFFYGGSWQEGARGDYRFVGEALARQGLVVVVPDYRLYPAVRYPAFLQDAAQAVAWTRSHIATYGGDPESLVLMGHSAGAYNAAMLTLDPDFLQAAGVQRGTIRGMVGLAGPYDFLPLKEPALQRIFAPAGDLRLTQPVSHADGRNPPMLLIHGRDDSRVRPSNSLRLAEQVRGAGGPAEVRIYDHLDHPWAVANLAAPLRWRSDLAGVVGGFARCVTQASTANPPAAVAGRRAASGPGGSVHSETDCLTARPG